MTHPIRSYPKTGRLKAKERFPLVTYPPQRKKMDADYERLSEQKNAQNKIYQDLKHELATLNYNLEELGMASHTIQGAVELSDNRA